jgi:hypothetical protein
MARCAKQPNRARARARTSSGSSILLRTILFVCKACSVQSVQLVPASKTTNAPSEASCALLKSKRRAQGTQCSGGLETGRKDFEWRFGLGGAEEEGLGLVLVLVSFGHGNVLHPDGLRHVLFCN